jgi:hypothetical protein
MQFDEMEVFRTVSIVELVIRIRVLMSRFNRQSIIEQESADESPSILWIIWEVTLSRKISAREARPSLFMINSSLPQRTSRLTLAPLIIRRPINRTL